MMISTAIMAEADNPVVRPRGSMASDLLAAPRWGRTPHRYTQMPMSTRLPELGSNLVRRTCTQTPTHTHTHTHAHPHADPHDTLAHACGHKGTHACTHAPTNVHCIISMAQVVCAWKVQADVGTCAFLCKPGAALCGGGVCPCAAPPLQACAVGGASQCGNLARHLERFLYEFVW